MINPDQLRELVIQPTLRYLDPDIPYSEEAVELLMMTAAHESKLGTYIKQVNGPALGIYQMEPATHDDIYRNFFIYKPKLMSSITGLRSQAYITEDELLVTNLMYATAMARVHYYRDSKPIPKKKDFIAPVSGFNESLWLLALAGYAKRVYNTEAGKATPEKYYNDYRKYVLGEKI